mmetsp:Transcript_18216/g.36734  ORF Transcript_18216/g.36734 Transcript_18216/m.36734 type:complete len:224 (-) Transcript_18216:2206-2877(-)
MTVELGSYTTLPRNSREYPDNTVAPLPRRISRRLRLVPSQIQLGNAPRSATVALERSSVHVVLGLLVSWSYVTRIEVRLAEKVALCGRGAVPVGALVTGLAVGVSVGLVVGSATTGAGVTCVLVGCIVGIVGDPVGDEEGGASAPITDIRLRAPLASSATMSDVSPAVVVSMQKSMGVSNSADAAGPSRTLLPFVFPARVPTCCVKWSIVRNFPELPPTYSNG